MKKLKAFSVLMIATLCSPAAFSSSHEVKTEKEDVLGIRHVRIIMPRGRFDIGSTYYTPGGTIQYRVDKKGRFYKSPAGPYVGRVDTQGRIYNNKGAFIGRIGLESFEFIL